MAGQWTSPTGFVDGGNWVAETNAYDEDTTTFASANNIPAASWSPYLDLTLDNAIDCDKIRYYIKASGFPLDAWITQIDIDVYYGGAWHDVYQGAITRNSWQEKNLGATYSVTKARVSLYNSHVSDLYAGLFYEFDFWDIITEKTASDTGSGADAAGKARSWGGFLELIIATITAYRVRFMALKETEVDFIDLDVYYGGAWHHLYQGSFDSMVWVSKSFDQQTTVTKARVRFYQDPTYTVKLYELEFYAAIT